jgi:hypothetical protein
MTLTDQKVDEAVRKIKAKFIVSSRYICEDSLVIEAESLKEAKAIVNDGDLTISDYRVIRRFKWKVKQVPQENQ